MIRLRKPAPELPWLAALSCAVPVDTPVVPCGLETPVASAGPYYLAAHTDSVAVLKREPELRRDSGRSISTRSSSVQTSSRATPRAQIEAGTLDYFLESQRPDAVARRRPPLAQPATATA